MQATLNIRQLLRQGGDALVGEADFCLAECDFLGFSVPDPVHLSWRAKPMGEVLDLEIALHAVIKADCVRCLVSFSREMLIEKSYDIRQEDLEGEYPEFPTTAEGFVDLETMAYEEVVLEVSPTLVCREDCPGLCTDCGNLADACTCSGKEARDPRWQALWHMLDDGTPE